MYRFEVKHIITYWKKPEQSNEKVAWLLYDHHEQTLCGYTFRETWELIKEFGATNAEAKIKKTPSRKIQEIYSLHQLPQFYHTSWQLNYENAQELPFSSSCLETISALKLADAKWKMKLKKDEWIRSHKELISSWNTYKNNLLCIELAHLIKDAENPVIYVGGSVWQEGGLPNLFPSAQGDIIEYPEQLFTLPIYEALTDLGIDANYHEDITIDVPYVFEFLKIARSLNPNINIFFEREDGLFINAQPQRDLIIAFGADVPDNAEKIESMYYIGHEQSQNSSQYKAVLHGPISQILKEVERNFVIKGRLICNVCGEKVAQGVGSSTIAPVTVAVCYSCGSLGAQPYGVVVIKASILKERSKNYRQGTYLDHVIRATLPIVGKSNDEFERDVDHHLIEMNNRSNK